VFFKGGYAIHGPLGEILGAPRILAAWLLPANRTNHNLSRCTPKVDSTTIVD
jgi:hypothetical protein